MRARRKIKLRRLEMPSPAHHGRIERIGTRLGRSTPEELAHVVEGLDEIIGI
jgi:hypothetical protein